MKMRFLCLCLCLLFALTLQLASSSSIVNYLPGFDGPLPFHLQTGYISVDDSELFYYFIESQGSPKTDPIFLWFTGGPGCSSFNGLIYEIGPLQFDIHNYEGGLPKLLYYPYSWTKTASFIFVDSPVGTGFSYSRTPQGWPTSDSKAAEQGYQFLRKWFYEHPKYLSLELFIAGDSYSGMIVPQVVHKILDGINAGIGPRMNIKGYLEGSPRTDSIIDEDSKVEFAHRMALISDETYEAAKINCQGHYVNADPSNTACMLALGDYEMCIKDLYTNCILEPKCIFASPEVPRRAALQLQKSSDFILSPQRTPELWCRNFNYSMSYAWANDIQVQTVLHVRIGTVPYWSRCNQTLSYTKDILSVVDIQRSLISSDLQVLIESGDRDMVVPFVGTEKWIKSLNVTVEDEWRPWFVDGQIAGYTRTYARDNEFRLTFATVKGAGHTAPEYHRRECYYMFDRWIHYYPL